MPIQYSKKLNNKLERMVENKTHHQMRGLSSRCWMNQSYSLCGVMDEAIKRQDCVIVACNRYCFIVDGDLETVEKMIMDLDEKPRVKISRPTPDKVAIKSMRNFFKDYRFCHYPDHVTERNSNFIHHTVKNGVLVDLTDFSGFSLSAIHGDLARDWRDLARDWWDDPQRVTEKNDHTALCHFIPMEINGKKILIGFWSYPDSLLRGVREFIDRGYTDQQLVEALTQCTILKIHEE